MTVEKYKNVADFIASLGEERAQQVDALRIIITSLDLELTEHIKWNAPSYVYDGEDRITFNLNNKENVVKLVLHMGATRKEDKKVEPVLNDDSGIVQWASDIRGMIAFENLADINAKENIIRNVLVDWLKIKHT